MDMDLRTSKPWCRTVTFLVVGCLVAVWGATGCGSEGDEYNPPGANARVGPVLIRYAHIAEPPDGPWKTGDDAPLYVWLFNQGQPTDRLLGAETTVARSVDIVTADGAVRGPVALPTGKLVELEKGGPHLLLRDLRQQIRGGDYVWITLRFERAGEIALQVHSQIPTYVDDERWPKGVAGQGTPHLAERVRECLFRILRVGEGPGSLAAPRTRKPDR